MANWNYTCKNGKALRNAIDGENTVKVLKALISCYEEIRSMLTEDDSRYYSDIGVFIYDIQDRLNVGDTE